MRREDLADLMTFAVIAQERSFTRAAIRLGLSSSALSHAIRLLEERLGTKLLSRTTRSVAPTAAGERLLSRLKPALDQIGEGLDSLADERDRPSGLVRINTHYNAALLHIVPRLKLLQEKYPDIVLDITTDDRNVDIVADGFDAGIRHGEHLARDMVAVRISPEYRTAIVAAPRYLENTQSIDQPSDLMGHHCLAWRFPTSGAMLRWEFREQSRKFHVVIEPALVTNDQAVLLHAALHGLGMAYVLRENVAAYLESGELVEVLADWAVPYHACYLYYPDRRQLRPAMRAVIDILRHDGSS